ncbi:hypothetical protein L2D08_19030 [Domibacillus sp. PGB-M46]|uniref:hypothetical protein n=1 Tax=Domibacillus sp. PGB-M46 TaxID=2910255 RepID=UPI001F594845|nr:hypothetical protein [Domibacillus sp. PGB-M46]MCI2256439.1 hypothetical protein [Domibacillus sp. PGB-M46]
MKTAGKMVDDEADSEILKEVEGSALKQLDLELSKRLKRTAIWKVRKTLYSARKSRNSV